MNKIPCLYSIVQFRPFVETGEFANVGILMIAPEQRYFGFKLMYTRHARVTHFFEQLNPKLFRTTMRNLREELLDARRAMNARGFDKRLRTNDAHYAKTLYDDIVRPRESVIRFSETRVVLAPTPEQTLEDLYAFYVERNFVSKEYQEALLERGVRKWLFQANLADRFEPRAVGDDVYHVNFPFVETANENAAARRAIKPLNLAQAHPSKILDHGGQWLFRIEQLRRRGALPERVLFAVSGPADGTRARMEAAADIITALEKQARVTVVPIADREGIIDFATH